MNNRGCSETEPVDNESKKNKAHLQMMIETKCCMRRNEKCNDIETKIYPE